MTLPFALLVGSVLGLILGPLVLQLRSSEGHWRATLDGFALVTAGGLSVLHLIPEALAHGGPASIAFAIIGLLLPLSIDWGVSKTASHLTSFVLLVGLMPHAALETALLGAASTDQITGLGAAIVGHRLPVGLFIYVLFQKQYGKLAAWGALSLLAVATVVGFQAGETLSSLMSETGMAWFQALVGGTLLHVAITYTVQEAPQPVVQEGESCEDETAHCGHAHEQPKGHLLHWSGVGALLGFMVLAVSHWFIAAHDHGSGQVDFLDTFWLLIVQAAPFLLLAYLLTGLITVVTTPKSAATLSIGGALSQSIRGTRFGLTLPICSSGVLPLYGHLIKNGVPATAAFAFLCATPALGLDAVLLSIPLLGWQFTLIRIGGALCIALMMALTMGAVAKKWAKPDPLAPTHSEEHPHEHEHEHEHEHAHVHEHEGRWWAGLRFGLFERFNHTIPWVLAGLLTAAWIEPLIGHNMLPDTSSWLQVAAFSLIGIPTYVCATGATPLAAIAIHKGVTTGATVAFLLVGPLMNWTVLRRIRQLQGSLIATLFAATLWCTACAVGVAVDSVFTPYVAELHPTGAIAPNPMQWGALVILGALFTRSVFTLGPRALVQQLTHPIHAH